VSVKNKNPATVSPTSLNNPTIHIATGPHKVTVNKLDI